MEIQNKYCWCLLVYSCYVVVHKYNVHTLTPLLLFSDNNTHTQYYYEDMYVLSR